MTAHRQPQRIGAIVESFLSERGYLSVCREQDILREWPKIVGERIAEVSTCTRVEDGIVYVRIPEAAWRQEISYFKTDIIEKIKQKTQCTTVTDIVFY
jgi:predicted nucleic acid-binding Zn ribbon protein